VRGALAAVAMLPERWRNRARASRTVWQWLAHLALAGVMGVTAIVFAALLIKLVVLLGHPL